MGVPRDLASVLPLHDVDHVTGVGLSGIRNDALMSRLSSDGYVGLITTDRNLSFPQAVPAMSIFVIVLVARSNRLADLCLLATDALRAIEFAQPGRVYNVGR